MDIPPGFEPLTAPLGPYFRALGPVYQRRAANGTLLFGLRLDERHSNIRGMPHGGMLATLADGALGINLVRHRQPPAPMVTVSLNSEFLAAARLGDWLEAHVTVRKTGRQLSFGDCLLKVGEREILRASAVFAVVSGRGPAQLDG